MSNQIQMQELLPSIMICERSRTPIKFEKRSCQLKDERVSLVAYPWQEDAEQT